MTYFRLRKVKRHNLKSFNDALIVQRRYFTEMWTFEKKLSKINWNQRPVVHGNPVELMI